ncbi:MFS transporter [Zongyangia hominis]|uniref:MFS transporter n=1 Tax=Zongyangia hominis TaxID=2763677 RepID=A0A926I6B7_9FIRM|nr:MFS transporter [Zongyangia hominis]MBC8569879.1 MFS transporter [Zongyangia hominis]
MNHWKKNFFTIWSGQAVSQFSSAVLQFAIVWYLTDHTGSALVLSASMLMGFLPQGILGPFIGVLIDRYDRKRIMVWSDLFIAGTSLVLVAAGFWGEPPVWLILLVLLCRSVGSALHNPCLQAVTPQIVPEEELTRCSGYSQSLQSISQIVSPAVAAVLYSWWSLSAIVLLDVLGAVAAVITLTVSEIPKLEKPKVEGKPHVLREAREGFRILRSKRGILGLVLISALYSLALMPTSALFPLMSMSYFGGTSVHASIAEITFSVGLLIGSLVLSVWGGTRRKVRTIVGSYLLMSASLILSGLLPRSGFAAFAVLSCLMGVSGPFYWGMYTPLLQQSFEGRYLGRVMALSSSIMVICSPIGLSLSGAFAEVFGVQNWFIVAGLLTLLAAALCVLVPSVAHCDGQKE